MNILLGLVVTLVVTAITVTVMLLVRRRAPEGSYFTDGDRASGVFGVLATGFSVLLGFIIFLAFSSYDESRSGAEAEATIVAQQVQTAQFLPDVECGAHRRADVLRAVRGRARVGRPRRPGRSGTRSTRGGPRCSARSRRSTRGSATEQSAYDRWMDQTSDREQARHRPDPRGGGHHPRSRCGWRCS